MMMMKTKKLKKVKRMEKILKMKEIYVILLLVLIITIFYVSNIFLNNDNEMVNLSHMTLNEIKEYAKDTELILEVREEHNDLKKGTLISQSIAEHKELNKNDKLTVVISLGPIPLSVYKDNNVNELGNIPVMMYHSIVNIRDDDTPYTGGNVDQAGVNRTTESFKRDLEMYYNSGYRMIRLSDYVNGNINTPLGKSPIVLTFDDGNRDNFNVLGVDDKGNLIIDPNCVIGILESFKAKYPDYNVTAIFFLNKNLFGQPKYNEQMLKWLVDNGYQVGNHTENHLDLATINSSTTQKEVAYMYKLFDSIIPGKYTHIVALPFGTPTNSNHSNFPYILKGNYEGYEYKTESTLRVGWDADYSPFHKKFDKTFIKRARAWDNNGSEFDIEMVFNNLNKTRYISDGNKDTIVIKNDSDLNTDIKNKKIIKY
jgi:peptidoglycan/xylan/chitin deacetylase (PgdA/CDA1 family)